MVGITVGTTHTTIGIGRIVGIGIIVGTTLIIGVGAATRLIRTTITTITTTIRTIRTTTIVHRTTVLLSTEEDRHSMVRVAQVAPDTTRSIVLVR